MPPHPLDYSVVDPQTRLVPLTLKTTGTSNHLTVLWSTLKCLAFHSNYNKNHWSPPPSDRLYCGRPWNAFHSIYTKNRCCLGYSTILWLTLKHVVCHFIYNKSLVPPSHLTAHYLTPKCVKLSPALLDRISPFSSCFIIAFSIYSSWTSFYKWAIMSQWSARSLPAADQVVFCAVSSGCKWPQVSL